MSEEKSRCAVACGEQLRQEFHHLRRDWFWLFLFGILLVVCGSAAIIFPALTFLMSVAVPVVLGVALMVAGIATIIASFWVGKWSGLLVQLLVGILYVVVGFMVTDKPLQATMAMTMFVAAFCIVVGIFRVVAALTVHYPYWGWSLLERHDYLPAGRDHLPPVPPKRDLGSWIVGGPGNAVPRVDVDHAVAGDQEDSRRGGVTGGV